MAVKYPITLSVSEPNNNIGLLKVRQADEESQTLVVQILEDAVPKSYEGLQVFFCARIGQTAGLGIIEQKLNIEEMTDPKNGKLEYTFRAEDWQVLGRQNGYFSFRKMSDDHTFVQQFSTRDFTFEVTKSIYSDGIKEVTKDGSTYVWTFEDLLRLLQEFKDSGESDFLVWFDEIKDQLSEDAAGNLMLLYQSLRDKTGKDSDFREFEADKSFMRRVFNESAERGVNVKWFGAKLDGLTDDSSALQAAIDYAALKNGGKVVIPQGKMLLEKTIHLKRGVYLSGFSTTRWETDGMGTDIVFHSDDPFFVGFDFRPMRKDGTWSEEVRFSAQGWGDFDSGVTDAGLRNLNIYSNSDNEYGCAVLFNQCPTSWLDNINIRGNWKIPFINVYTWGNSVRNVYAQGLYFGHYTCDSNNTHYDTCSFVQSNREDLDMTQIFSQSTKIYLRYLSNQPQKGKGTIMIYSFGLTFTCCCDEWNYDGFFINGCPSVTFNQPYLENSAGISFFIYDSAVVINGMYIGNNSGTLFKLTEATATVNGVDKIENYSKLVDTIDYKSFLNFPNGKPVVGYGNNPRINFGFGPARRDILVVDNINGDDGNAGYSMDEWGNVSEAKPVKTLAKAFAIAERSEFDTITIYLVNNTNKSYDLSATYTLRKNYKFLAVNGNATNGRPIIRRTTDVNRLIFQNGVSFNAEGIDFANTINSEDDAAMFYLDGNVSISLKNGTVSTTSNGSIFQTFTTEVPANLNLTTSKVNFSAGLRLYDTNKWYTNSLTVIEASKDSTVASSMLSSSLRNVRIIYSDLLTK